MAYFEELPDISYVSLLPNSSRNDDRIKVKNIFKRAKLRSDIDQAISAFEYYQITENTRPDTLAEQLYDNPELDWVVLTSNNITNIRNEWPLSHNDLQEYMLEKYGSDANIAKVHHFETREILDEFSRVVMPAGLQVDETFTFKYKNSTNSILNVNPVSAITNYQYEVKLNDQKRRIRILKSEFLSAFISEHREIMSYGKSSNYISKKLKRTYNPRLSGV